MGLSPSHPKQPVALHPINLGYGLWTPGVNKAECKTKGGAHHPAEPECGCGFWIKDSFDGAIAHRSKNFTVIGVAMGWGRVQIHGDGWRCEHATPLALAFDPFHNTGEAYGTLVGMEAALKQIGLMFEVPILPTPEELKEWYIANTAK